MEKNFTKDEIEKLSKLNSKAKELVKEGKFRTLSDVLVEIKKNVEICDTDSIGNPKPQIWIIEREILRYKLLVYQHLNYFDSISGGWKEENATDEAIGAVHGDNISLKTLFKNLNYLRRSEIIDEKKISDEGMKALSLIDREGRESREVWEHKSPEEKKLWQERVWVVLGHCLELFRQNFLEATISNLERMNRFVFDKLSSKDFPCYATKATLLAELAKAYRRNGDYKKAEKLYFTSIKHYLDKTRHPKDNDREYQRNALKYQFRRVAQLFSYGLQQIHASRSDINRCEANLLIAELLLSGKNEDEITPRYVQLSRGIIKRIKSGTSKEGLAEAKQEISEVRKYFDLLAHKRMLIKCDWELAIIHHLLEEHESAENIVADIESHYLPIGDYRALANIYILRSHIQRTKGQLIDSLSCAKKGLEYAEKSKNRIARKDAHIALAESAFIMEKHTKRKLDIDAYVEFERVLKINEKHENRKIDVISYLGLCKVAAFRGDKVNADKYWEKYKLNKNSIEHAFVTDVLEADAVSEINRLNADFVISGRISNLELNYDHYQFQLKKWLYEKAKKPNQSKDELAKTLGVSRQTIREWEKKFAGKHE